MTRRLVALLLVLVLAGVALPAFAGGRVVYRLALQPPPEVLAADSKAAKNSFADIATERLRKRFEAASVKEFEFRMSTPNTLVIETGWNHERGWLEALMTAPGKVEIRRVTPEKPNWLTLAAQIPAGVELRGDDPPYLWSAQRSALAAFLARITLPNGRLTVFPDPGGFRSVSLGEIVATERQIKAVQALRSSTGTSFISIDFETAVGASLAALHVSEVEQVAIMLDGELVAFVPAKSFLEHSPVRVSVPEGAVPDDRVQHDLWIRQVAGRLAAPLPIAIAVLKE